MGNEDLRLAGLSPPVVAGAETIRCPVKGCREYAELGADEPSCPTHPDVVMCGPATSGRIQCTAKGCSEFAQLEVDADVTSCPVHPDVVMGVPAATGR